MLAVNSSGWLRDLTQVLLNNLHRPRMMVVTAAASTHWGFSSVGKSNWALEVQINCYVYLSFWHAVVIFLGSDLNAAEVEMLLRLPRCSQYSFQGSSDECMRAFLARETLTLPCKPKHMFAPTHQIRIYRKIIAQLTHHTSTRKDSLHPEGACVLLQSHHFNAWILKSVYADEAKLPKLFDVYLTSSSSLILLRGRRGLST